VHLRRLPLGGVLGQRDLTGSRVDHVAPIQLRLGVDHPPLGVGLAIEGPRPLSTVG